MGTRADFYVGRGIKAEWLGSIAYDGHPENFYFLDGLTEVKFRKAVAKFLAEDENATLPAEGWPWPWEDSSISDYAYAFDDGVVYHSEYAKGLSNKVWVCFDVKRDEDGYALSDCGKCIFPNMTEVQKVKMPGSQGSGSMLIRGMR